MPVLSGSRTERNLLSAFAGEAQNRNYYTYFADQAAQEGYEQIAAAFKETADNESAHARRLLQLLNGSRVRIDITCQAATIGSTEENLKASAKGERYEHTILYPEFAAMADEEGFPEIAAAFRAIIVAEKGHEQRHLTLLNHLKKSGFFTREQAIVWKCRDCGFIHEGKEAPVDCQICASSQSRFERMPDY